MFDQEKNRWMWGSPVSHLQSWIRKEILKEGGRLINSTNTDPTFSGRRRPSQDPEKYPTNNRINPMTVCTAAVGSLVHYFLISIALRPPSFLTQLPQYFSPQAFFTVIVFLTNADSHARSQAQRLYHISISQDSSSHMHSVSVSASLMHPSTY